MSLFTLNPALVAFTKPLTIKSGGTFRHLIKIKSSNEIFTFDKMAENQSPNGTK